MPMPTSGVERGRSHFTNIDRTTGRQGGVASRRATTTGPATPRPVRTSPSSCPPSILHPHRRRSSMVLYGRADRRHPDRARAQRPDRLRRRRLHRPGRTARGTAAWQHPPSPRGDLRRRIDRNAAPRCGSSWAIRERQLRPCPCAPSCNARWGRYAATGLAASSVAPLDIHAGRLSSGPPRPCHLPPPTLQPPNTSTMPTLGVAEHARRVKDRFGLPLVVTVTGRNRTRHQAEHLLEELAGLDLAAVHCVTGRPPGPASGWKGHFALDSQRRVSLRITSR